MSFTIRPVNKNNQQELLTIAEADARIPLEFDSSHPFDENSVNARLDYYQQLSENDFFEVATQQERIIGFHIVKKSPFPPSHTIANIISLWVHPDFRKQGIAKELKNRAEYWAKQGGMLWIQTHVHKSNARMLELNKSNGYEEIYISLRKTL